MNSRRSFLKTLVVGLVAGPSLVKAALKPTPRFGDLLVTDYRGFKFVRTPLDASSDYARAVAAAINRERDNILLRAICDPANGEISVTANLT